MSGREWVSCPAGCGFSMWVRPGWAEICRTCPPGRFSLLRTERDQVAALAREAAAIVAARSAKVTG